MKETNIDARKHRKSTHLASADLDSLELEGRKLIFTIKEVWYETGVNVSGDKKDGYFCSFVEPGIKDLMLNSANKKMLSGFAKKKGFEGKDAWNIGNWKGLRVEFFVDRNVKMMGAITEGIRIKPIMPEDRPKPIFTEANFEKAKAAKATIELIKQNYQIDLETEKKYLEYVK